MKRLTYQDLQRISGILPEVYGHTELRTFPLFAAEVVHRVVAADLIEFNEVGVDQCVLTQKPTSPEGLRHYDAFKALLNKHPVLISQDSLRRVECAKELASGGRSATRDDEFYRLVGITDQLAFAFAANLRSWVSVVLNRWKQAFRARDDLMVRFLQPHIAQAHRNAVALNDSRQKSESLSGAFASMHRGLVVLDEKGQALWMTPSAQRWLGAYFPGSLDERRLPRELQRWIQDRRAWLRKNGRMALPEPLVITQSQSRLLIRFSEDSRQRQFLFLKEEKSGVCPSAFIRLGLTRREGEVLYWICQGKTNPEIAAVETISLRTVHKHVEHILAKLSVETRAAAMLTALQALDEAETIGQEEAVG
ncbi:MAG: helix-turn-helix transcriptional regulator [Verrucomicrobia bacterium]|nr:helix-turn-helix transcriptional regulator [Verrucomicrobiota bacterium]